MKTLLLLAITLGGGLVPAYRSAAQTISYSGGTLTEDFDSIGPAGTNTPPGWFVGYAEPTNLTNVAVNDGSIAPNGTAGWNFGTANGTDRALGTMATSTGSAAPNDSRYVEARIRNDSDQSISAITITYDGEQWRTGSSTSIVTRLTLRYSADGVNFADMGTEFNFVQPTLSPASVALDGSANRVAGLGGIYNLPAPVPAGATFYLRWFDANDANTTDPALAIDHVSFSASTPQPVSLGLSAPANGQSYLVGDNATVTTTNTGSISNVAFLVDGEPRFLDSSAPYEFVLADLTAGPHILRAIATGNDGLNATSAPVTITVTNLPGMTVLVANGSVWKYRDDGSDQGTAWRAPGFNDVGWNSGPAELGFGDSGDNPPRPERTVINGGPANNRHVTTYFRHIFNVPNPGAYSNLLVRLLRDDGGVVYLNGVEVLRSNLDPTNPIAFTTLAFNAVDDGTILFPSANLSPTLLAAGPNVLAVEVHQTSLTSSDLSFDAMLLAQGAGNQPPVIQRQPLSGTVTLGQPVTLMVTAVGGEPLIYQWFFNGTALPGATSAELNIGPAEPQAAGNYTVEVRNPFGVVTSAAATLAFGGNAPINDQFQVWAKDAVSLAVVGDEIERLGGVIREASLYFGRILFSGTEEVFAQIAASPNVRRDQRVHELGLYNFNSRFAIDALPVLGAPYGLGVPVLTGAGVVAGVWDGGTFGLTHPDYAFPRLTVMEICGPTSLALDSHAAHVIGTMAGDGVLFNNSLAGLAPQATIKCWSALLTCAGYSALLPQDEMFNARDIASSGWPAPRIDFCNNSWGYLPNLCSLYGSYPGDCEDYDRLVRQEELSIFFAAGNYQSGLNSSTLGPCFAPGFGGYGTVLPLGTAKNVVTVGAIDALNTLTVFSSCGPTADGRLKPDIVAPGNAVYSTTHPWWQSWPPYFPLSGTSMATPAVSGTAALLLEQFANLSLPSPSPALHKAILCNRATDLGIPGPDFQYGYGKVNAEKSVDTILNGQFDDVTGGGGLATGGVWTRQVKVQWGCKFSVMVAWSDEPYLGPNPQGTTLINNLDLWLVDPSGGIHRPLTLNPFSPASPAVPAVNFRDNVEQVVIGSAQGGIWSVVVNGTSVPQGPQEFAVTWGVDCPAACPPQPIQGLWNTGLDLSGNQLPAGWVDPHYALIGWPTGTAFTDARHDFYPWFWLPDGPNSFWLQPGPPATEPNGTYIYQLTFDLGTCDPNTASITGRWAADDWAELQINGVPVPGMNAAYAFVTWAPFSITSGFQPGLNTIQFVVENIGGHPTGLRVELSGTVCCGCIKVPPNLPNMVAWWPLDEPPGATTYAELINTIPTSIQSGPLGPPLGTLGPQAVSGKVAGGSCFPRAFTYGQANNSPWLNFVAGNGNGSFSLDCWVMLPPGVGGPFHTIVDKLQTSLAGYKVGINAAGNVELQIGNGTVYTRTSTGLTVPSSVWTFVGVTVDRSTANATVTFYVNGASVTAPTIPLGAGSTANFLDLFIGGNGVSGVPPAETCLDEVELFNRVLTPAEMTGIFTADSAGKCKPCLPVPVNDGCANPKTLMVNVPLVCETTLCATPTPPATVFSPTPCGGSLRSNDVWYSVQALCNGNMTVDTCLPCPLGPVIDTVLSAYLMSSNPNCSPLTQVSPTVCDDDSCGASGLNSTIVFPVTAGSTYLIRVADGLLSAGGYFTIQAVLVPTPPTLICAGPKTVQCGAPIVFDPPITATDNCCGGALVPVIIGTTLAGVCPQTTTRTWSVTDCNGNSATCSQTVTLADTTPPVFAGCPAAPINLGCNPPTPSCTTVATLGITAGDVCSGNVVPVCVAGPVVVNGCQRSQVFTLTATDACGNTAICTVTYNWTADTTAPVFVGCPVGPVSLGCNPAALPTCALLAAFTAADTCSGNIVPVCVAGPVVVNGCQRSQTFTLTATDACGNTATCAVPYNWTVDTTSPVFAGCPAAPINLIGCSPILPTCATVAALGITANDACSGNLVPTCAAGPVVVTGSQFSQSFTLTATDACGNPATCNVAYNWTLSTPPPNDLCANATLVTLSAPANSFTTCGTTTCATPSAPGSIPIPCGNSSGPDVWYTFKPPCDGQYVISTCGDCAGTITPFNTVLSVYTDQVGLGCGLLTPVACNDNGFPFLTPCFLQSRLFISGIAGATYYIRAAGSGIATGNFQLNILQVGPPVTPSNDLCVNATPVSAGTHRWNNCGANTDGPLGGGCPGVPRQNVWFSYTPACAGSVSLSTCNSGIDTVLAVYSGFCGTAPFPQLGCSDDAAAGPCGGSQQSYLTFNAAAGVTYLISVGSSLVGVTGSGLLTILGPNPPAPACPPAGGQLSCRMFQVKGPPNGTPWAWTITAPCCANVSVLNVPGVPAAGNNANTLAQAFVNSINSACPPGSSLSAQAFPNPNFPGIFKICMTCPTYAPLQLAVGPAGTPPQNQCVVPQPGMFTPLPITGGPCNFNPDIIGLPQTDLDENDNGIGNAKGNGIDDGAEIALGMGADVNGDFILDVTPTPPVIDHTEFVAGTLSLSFAAKLGQTYVVEYKNNLADPSWTPLETVVGDGFTHAVTDAGPLPATRFYRLKLMP